MVCELFYLKHGAVFLIFLAGFIHSTAAQSGSATSTTGTTLNFTTIFVNQCNQFQLSRPEIFTANPKNCTQLLQIFLNSFANKSKCNVSLSDYDAFLLAANHTASITNKALFWSLVNPFVYAFSGAQNGKYMTILDLLSGYTLNGTTWCWNSTNNDLDYNNCSSCPLKNDAYTSFWSANSAYFANISTGTVYAMLNGSTTVGAFTNISIFYRSEVPSMTYPKITAMDVFLVQNPGGPYSENCQNGTLVDLRKQLQAKNITFICNVNPDPIRQFQCSYYQQYANTYYCMPTQSGTSTTPSGTATILNIPLTSLLCRSILILFATKLHRLL